MHSSFVSIVNFFINNGSVFIKILSGQTLKSQNKI